MRLPLVVSLLLAGCGSSADPAITIEGGPLLLLEEGGRVEVPLDVTGAEPGSACAPPFGDDLFTATLPDGGEDAFATFQVETALGGAALVLEPRCDAVVTGAGARHLGVRIGASGDCATPAFARLQIADVLGDACAPRVTAWYGDCALEPVGAGTSVVIPAAEQPAELCVRVASRAPEQEHLWVRASSNVPATVLRRVDLPDLADFQIEQTFAVPLGDTRYVRGRFRLDYLISRTAPGEVFEADASGTIELIVGDEGIGIAVANQAALLSEHTVTVLPVQLFALPPRTADDLPLCARASRVPPPAPPLQPTRTFLRISGADDPTDQGTGWVCGERFAVAVSPPVDSAPLETIELEASQCLGCDGPTPTPDGPTVSRQLSFDSFSTGDQVACGAADDGAAVAVSCADIAGDATPELLFHRRGGSDDVSCAYRGGAGRAEPLTWEAGSEQVPLGSLALTWRDPAVGPVEMIVGVFPTVPRLRRLEYAGTAARWVAAPLGIPNAPPLEHSRTLAADPSQGATHLASPMGGVHVIARCIAPNDPVVTGCQDVTFADVVPATHTVRDLGLADLDGDGTRDLVAFATRNASPFDLTVVAIALDWPTADAPAELARQSVQTPVLGDSFPSSAVDRPGCLAPPCRQELVAAPIQAASAASLMLRVFVPGSLPLTQLTSQSTTALHETRGLTTLGDRIIVGMAFEVAEASPTTMGLEWIPQDPVVLERSLVGPLLQQPPEYGSSITACEGSAKTVAFTISSSGARFTRLDIPVDVP